MAATDAERPKPVGVPTRDTPGEAIPATNDRAARRPRRGATIAFRVVAIAVGLLAPLLALELALRAFGPFLPGNYDTGALVRRHPTLGHFHTPNFRGWVKTSQFTVQIDFNAWGLRDARTSYVKPDGTFRILALGDSYVEAAQVQQPQTMASRLEGVLESSTSQRVEVVNAGVFGYGTAQEYVLLDEIGADVRPDLVVLFFCHCNDIPNNNYRLELINGELSRALKPYFDYADDDAALRFIPPPAPSPRTSLRERLRDSSLLYNVIETGVVYKFELQNPQEAFNGIDGLEDPTRGKYDTKPRGEWERSWRITDAVIEKLRDRVKQIGARLVIVGIPEWRMLERGYWQRNDNKRLVDSGRGGPDAPIQLLDGIAGRLGVPHLDLRTTFQPRVDADGLHKYYLESDFHWTVDGNVVAADAVGAFLLRQGLVPR
jgi:hypothetical protein